MRLGILSDTHDEITRTRLAIQMLRDYGAEGLIHCGDLASSPIIESLGVLPSWFVFGNHDADLVPSLQKAATDLGPVCLGWSGTIELSGKTIAVAHGHMRNDVRAALQLRPHYLLSGHLHVASDRQEGVVRRINPGALHEADVYSVALLDLETDELRFIDVP